MTQNNKNFLADKIIVCEDDAVLRKNISAALEMEGYHVYEASNGMEAKQLFLSKRVSLIVSDWAMPVMDGLDLLKFAKSDARFMHIPFLFLTAKTTVDNKLTALGLMADDYITKPFSLHELVYKCRNNIENRKQVIIANLVNDVESNFDSRDQRFLQQIKQFIDKHIANDELALSDFAAEFPMSVSSIQKNIKRICGQSLFRLIIDMRLQKAKNMIEADAAPISEILYHCGFNNHNHFTKKFKDKYDILPSKLSKKDRNISQ
jgi:DNA-binding response OmpR family regulator